MCSTVVELRNDIDVGKTMVSKKLNDLFSSISDDIISEIKTSLDIINEAFDKFKFEELALSFNGGKDCTVVLHLLRCVLEKRFPEAGKFLSDLKIVYFEKNDEFPEMLAFVESIKVKYGISIDVYKGSYKEGLEIMEKEGVKAVFMGQRRSDPHAAKLEHFSHCTTGWPDVIRVNPILDWSYSTVWTFLKGCDLEYCKLYDEGYTSLGSVATTKKNPLLVADGDHKPAHELKNGDEVERVGRSL